MAEYYRGGQQIHSDQDLSAGGRVVVVGGRGLSQNTDHDIITGGGGSP